MQGKGDHTIAPFIKMLLEQLEGNSQWMVMGKDVQYSYMFVFIVTVHFKTAFIFMA